MSITSNIASAPKKGLHVYVHNQSSIPRSTEGIDVASGSHTNIIVNRVFVTKLGNPYNDCQSNVDNIDSGFLKTLKANNQNRTYNQKLCFELCFQNNLVENCGCYATFLIRSNSSVPCFNQSKILCLDKYTENFYNEDVDRKCSPFCPLPCENIEYSLSTSTADYPSPAYLNKYLLNDTKFQPIFGKNDLKNVFDLFQAKYKVASFDVYYNSLSYTKITEYPKMLPEELVAFFGGTFGLFLGLSFLSMAEIFELFFQVLIILYEHTFHNQILPTK